MQKQILVRFLRDCELNLMAPLEIWSLTEANSCSAFTSISPQKDLELRLQILTATAVYLADRYSLALLGVWDEITTLKSPIFPFA